MNGIIAAAFWTSAILNPDFPLFEGIGQREAIGEKSIQTSNVYFQRNISGQEIGFSLLSDKYFGPLQPVASASLTTRGGFWVGYGFENELAITNKMFLNFSFIPGLYSKGGEEDLGGWLMFRSGIGIKYKYSNAFSFSFVYDHRSSGDIWEYNPGMETLQLKFHRRY